MSYGENVHQWMHGTGFEYNRVEDIEILTLSHQERSTSEPDLMHRSMFRGIKNKGFTHDAAFNHYSNGGTFLHLGAPNQTLAAGPSDFTERTGFGHVGFRISFTTRQGAALTKAQKDDMALNIAQDWRLRSASASDENGLV